VDQPHTSLPNITAAAVLIAAEEKITDQEAMLVRVDTLLRATGPALLDIQVVDDWLGQIGADCLETIAVGDHMEARSLAQFCPLGLVKTQEFMEKLYLVVADDYKDALHD
jgi:hypothetical protein